MHKCVRSALFIVAGFVCAVAESAAVSPPEILVLSNRADLISGGDALVEIKWPAGANTALAKIAVDGVNVKPAFAMRANGRYMGLLTGLKNGNSVLTARIPGAGAQITINNHPIGGPVFAGAQMLPWICAMVTATVVNVTVPGTSLSANATTKVSGLDFNPVDAQCNAPSKYTYYYQKTTAAANCTFTTTGGNPCFTAYSPAARPTDAEIANFTNDRGVTVKSLIRVERGTINRGIYELVTFYDPAVASAPWAPQPGWNGKLLWKFGAASSYSRFQNPPATAASDDTALRRGFMVASSSMTDHSLNANDTLGAETMMMVKEHIIDTYGQVRYTIGNGCSGGSIYQYQIAAAYPGLLDGIQPTCTFPDTFTTGIEVGDCGLLGLPSGTGGPLNYYATVNGLALTDTQKAAINGHTNIGTCRAWITSFLGNGKPSNSNCGAGFPVTLIYEATARPDGVRCTGPDHSAAILGKFVDTDGNTKTASPNDNEGVQYGLKALAGGVISAEEFVRLNEGVGSFTADQVWIPPTRKVAFSNILHTVYSSGIVSDGKQLAKAAIIDLRGNQATAGDIHQNWRAFEARARLDKANGQHDNQVIWGYTGNGGAGTPGPALLLKSFLTMDAWLANIENDHSANPIEAKVVSNKPLAAKDLCLANTGTTEPLIDVGLGTPACLSSTFQSSPRQVAGGPLAEDVFKCQLKPLDLAAPEYNGVAFTQDQQDRLNAVFATGVCDWSKPGVEQVPANPWTTFAAGPGGQSLGSVPVSVQIP